MGAADSADKEPNAFHHIAVAKEAGVEPAVDLLRAACADNGPAHARPGKRPGNRDGGRAHAMARGNRLQGLGHLEIALQPLAREFRVARTPIVLRQLRRPLFRKRAAQQARLHRAVDDHPGPILQAPGQNIRLDIAPWQLRDLRRTYRTIQASIGTTREISERLINHVSEQGELEKIYDQFDYAEPMEKAQRNYEAHLKQLLQID